MTNSEIPAVKGNHCLVTTDKKIKLSEEQKSKESVAKIAFKGDEVTFYDVGDKVLIDENKCTEIKYFKDVYLKIHQDFIICKIVQG